MSNCVSPVLSYGELHYGYEYQICKRIFLQEKDPFHVCMESGNHRSDSSCGGIFLVFLQKCRGAGGLDGADSRAGERVLMDSAWYRLSSPKRGDIIAFRTSEDKKASIHIKRVIALPGETVQIKDGQILINGEVYNEKMNFRPSQTRDLPPSRSRSGRDSTLCSATTGTTARTAATTAWDSWIRTALSESSGLRFRRGRKSVSCKRSIEGEET